MIYLKRSILRVLQKKQEDFHNCHSFVCIVGSFKCFCRRLFPNRVVIREITVTGKYWWRLTHPDLKNITTVESFVELTCHNLIQDLTCLFGGLLLFIPSLFISAINAYNFLTIFITYPLPVIIYGILPHGIFEIPSSIFALAGAIMLFKTGINVIKGIISSKTTVKDKINESEYLIKDAIITCFIVILLLVVAGFIEIFITPGLIDNFALDYI